MVLLRLGHQFSVRCTYSCNGGLVKPSWSQGWGQLRSWSWNWSWNLRSWSCSWYSRDLPELELELELKLSGVGVGIGVEILSSFYIYIYIQVLFETYNFENCAHHIMPINKTVCLTGFLRFWSIRIMISLILLKQYKVRYFVHLDHRGIVLRSHRETQGLCMS